MERLIIFDGDDTLWITEPLYDEVRASCARFVGECGVDPAEWEVLQRDFDVARAARLGYSPSRFAGSCVAAARALARRDSRELSINDVERLHSLASSVFEMRSPLAECAADVLDELSGSHNLVLLTAGNPAVQRRRITDSGLVRCFDEIFIVPRKTATTFAGVRGERAPSHCVSIGNSVPSDINPALADGMSAIWVPNLTWQYERRESLPSTGEVYVALALADVPRYVEKWVEISAALT